MEPNNKAMCNIGNTETFSNVLRRIFPDFQKPISVNEVECLVTSMNVIEISDASEYNLLYEFVQEIVKPGLLKDLSKNLDGFTDENFKTIAEPAVNSFLCLKQLLSKLEIKLILRKNQESIFVPILILCGAHSQNFPWSNDKTFQLSQETQKAVLVCAKVADMKSLLCTDREDAHSSIFKSALLAMRPSLTKESWTNNPCICMVFKWFLLQVTHPNLTDYLPDVLPPCLMFTDHYHVHSKVLGIECLHHIIDNVPPSELKMFGRADVVYDALFHLTYCKELEVVCILYPCILKLLIGQEGNMHCKHYPRKWNRYDVIYHQLMWAMDMENTLALRREFSKFIPDFIQEMGITILKHFKRTLRVLLDYLKIPDYPSDIARINALKAINILIKAAWIRMDYHCQDIIKGIMFLLRDVKKDTLLSCDTVQEISSLCQETIMLLEAACPQKIQDSKSPRKCLAKS